MVLGFGGVGIPGLGQGGGSSSELVAVAGGAGAGQYVVEHIAASGFHQGNHDIVEANITAGNVISVGADVGDQILQNTGTIARWHEADRQRHGIRRHAARVITMLVASVEQFASC